MKPDALLQNLAEQLWNARATGRPIAPLRDAAALVDLEPSTAHAYLIQRINRLRRVAGGDAVAGRKIGLTSLAVQKQLGVDQPDFGDLWASTAYADGDTVPLAGFIQPKVEAEVALVLEHDLDAPRATAADLIRATAFALPALEIVDSRIAQWKIGLFDTIADNASAGGFVLGADPVKLTDCRLRDAAMRLLRGGEQVSAGRGRDCLGHPLNAAAWLARTLAAMGEPLRAGDIVLTGALGPMVTVAAGDAFEATIDGLGAVAVSFR
jgi:2-keto-4-pentenoate hydratase